MAELGDLTEFFKEGSGGDVPNLDWLVVDEKAYREADHLPKQNLEITPDLKALWRHEDQPSTGFVPNTGAPRTMGDLSQLHGMLRKGPEDLLRTARLTIMQTTDPQRIQHALKSRYDAELLRGSRTALASVLGERGLLGRYYIDASDFVECRTGSKKASDFVRRFAQEAKFVKVKEACTGCIHRQGGDHCGVFHKQLVMDVPYTPENAAQVEWTQQARGKSVQASTATPKERIRQAFLAEGSQTSGFTGRSQAAQKPMQASTPDQLIAVESLLRKRQETDRQKIASQQARPVVAMLRREMLKGRSKAELSTALRLAFDERDLKATQAEWAPIYKQAGLFGAVYSTQDSFEDCREGADLLAKHGSSVRAIVAGEKCGSCIFSQIGRCMMYGRKLVKNAAEVFTPEVVSQVLDEHKIAGRLPVGAEHLHWGTDPVAALQAIHEAAMGPKVATTGNPRANIETGFYGATRAAGSNDLTKRAIVQAMAQYMNEGLYGNDLVAVLRNRFEVRDLAASRTEMRTMLAEQGLQGIKYIDPRVYNDYGHGCHEAARKHRSRAAVRYAKVGDKCASCVHQTRPGHCSVLNKQLVLEPPYIDKRAEQEAVLATGRSTEIGFEHLVNNGLSMMDEYQLQHREANIELAPEPDKNDINVEFGIQGIRL